MFYNRVYNLKMFMAYKKLKAFPQRQTIKNLSQKAIKRQTIFQSQNFAKIGITR